MDYNSIDDNMGLSLFI